MSKPSNSPRWGAEKYGTPDPGPAIGQTRGPFSAGSKDQGRHRITGMVMI
jgi:hypothetical protein